MFVVFPAKYWSSKALNDCPVLDDSQGITLNSLGGIFLATLCGLLLSMITLAYEVWQQKKQEKNQVCKDTILQVFLTVLINLFVQVEEILPPTKSGFDLDSSNKVVNVGNKQITLSAEDKRRDGNKGLSPISGFY